MGAAAKEHFTAVIKPEADRNFFLVIARGELLVEEAKTLNPFVVSISWRKTRAMWLPQFPVLIFSSAKTIRLIDAAKNEAD